MTSNLQAIVDMIERESKSRELAEKARLIQKQLEKKEYFSAVNLTGDIISNLNTSENKPYVDFFIMGVYFSLKDKGSMVRDGAMLLALKQGFFELAADIQYENGDPLNARALMELCGDRKRILDYFREKNNLWPVRDCLEEEDCYEELVALLRSLPDRKLSARLLSELDKRIIEKRYRARQMEQASQNAKTHAEHPKSRYC